LQSGSLENPGDGLVSGRRGEKSPFKRGEAALDPGKLRCLIVERGSRRSKIVGRLVDLDEVLKKDGSKSIEVREISYTDKDRTVLEQKLGTQEESRAMRGQHYHGVEIWTTSIEMSATVGGSGGEIIG